MECDFDDLDELAEEKDNFLERLLANSDDAGLRRIEYVFVYPETGDLVVAGPAGDWTVAGENRVVSRDTGEPVVRLDDLVVVFRHMLTNRDAHFGCMINPRQESLQRAVEFLKQSAGRPIPPGAAARKAWCEQFRAAVGKEDIEMMGGLDPQTRAARTVVEADYRMKLVTSNDAEELVAVLEEVRERIPGRYSEAIPDAFFEPLPDDEIGAWEQ